MSTLEAQQAATTIDMDLDDLLELYIDDALKALDRETAERKQLRAAFESGTPLTAKVQLDLYDPIDGEIVTVPAGAVVHVAEHQGDILIGKLSDNTHSLAVVYEPPGRWIPRKHFLPLSTLVDRTRITQGESPSVKSAGPGGFKGAGLKGLDDGTALAIQSIDALNARDAFAVLPRGTRILIDAAQLQLEEGAPTPSGEIWVEVTAAVGDVRDKAGVTEMPEIPIRITGGPSGTLPFEALQPLSFKTHVLTPVAYAQYLVEQRGRRRFLRRMTGAGLAAAFLAMDGIWWTTSKAEWPPNAPPADRVLSAMIPQLGALLGYLRAGGKYWFELDGPLMSLREARRGPAVRALSDALDQIAAISDHTWDLWRGAFYRRVHVGWNEHKHYRTDKDGKRTYTHSTWTKSYRKIWCEPPGLSGTWSVLQDWDTADDWRRSKGHRMLNVPIFQLLECTPEEAESQFRTMRMDVSFAREATISAVTAALCSAPAAFYSDILGAFNGVSQMPHPAQSRFPAQKPALLAMGAIAGAFIAQSSHRKQAAELGQNKKALGALLETQLRTVPEMDFEQAWNAFFGIPSSQAVVQTTAERGPETHDLGRRAQSFTYVHSGGFDRGRPLDSIYVDAGPVKTYFPEIAQRWGQASQALADALREAEVLLPVLQNVVGTDILNARIREDASEASSGGWKQSLWFAAPIWGAALLDGLLKR
ncbi:MAG: hypothetical protein ACE366_30340 [Bradymonadia bacterium]